MAKRRPIQIGDRVALSATFLRAMQMQRAEPAFQRGTVKGFEGELAQVEWDEREPGYVNVCNLTHTNRLHEDAELAPQAWACRI